MERVFQKNIKNKQKQRKDRTKFAKLHFGENNELFPT